MVATADDKSFLQKATDASYYPTGLVQNQILDIIGGETMDSNKLVHGEEVLTTPDFINRVANKYGYKYNTEGDNFIESTAKFLLETAVDIGTDPLTYVPIAGQAAIANKLGKYLKLGMPVNVAEKLATVISKATPSMLYGGVIGAAYKPENDTVGNRITNSLTGAVALPVAGHTVKAGLKGLRGTSNLVHDSVAGLTRGTALDKFRNEASKDAIESIKGVFGLSSSKAAKLNKEAKKSYIPYTKQFHQLDADYIAKYGEDTLTKTLDEIRPRYENTIKERNLIIDTILDKKNNPKSKRKIGLKTHRELTKAMNVKDIANLKKEGLYTKPVEDFIKLNAKKFSIINKSRLVQWLGRHSNIDPKVIEEQSYDKLKKFYAKREGKEWTELEYIALHVPDVVGVDDMLESYNRSMSKAGFLNRVSEEPIRTGGLTGKQILEYESEKLYKNMLSQTEKDIDTYLSNLKKQLPDRSKPLKFMESGLGLYDKVTNNMKNIMLTMGVSWLRNNLTENITRALTEDGLVAGVKSGSRQVGSSLAYFLPENMAKSLAGTEVNELIKATKHGRDGLTKYVAGIEKGGKVETASNLGVIGHNVFSDMRKQLGSKEGITLARLKRGSQEVDRMVARQESKNPLMLLSKAGELAMNFSRDTVGALGSMMENAARFSSWDTYLQKSLTNEERKIIDKYTLDKAIKINPSISAKAEKAASRVNDIFFDYGDLSSGEEAVLKRMFPFYSFASKNLDYVSNKLTTDPKSMLRYMRLHGYMVNYRPNDKNTNRILSDFEKSRAFTGVKYNADGKPVVTSMSKASLMDFLDISDPLQYGSERLNPILKSVGDAVLGVGELVGLSDGPKDGLGRKKSVSEEKPRKPFSGELPIAQALNGILGNTKASYLDANEGLRLSNNVVPVLDSLFGAFIPPAAKRISRIAEEEQYRQQKGTKTESVLEEYFNPVTKKIPDRNRIKSNVRMNQQEATKKNNLRKAILRNRRSYRLSPNSRDRQRLHNRYQ